MDLTTTYMGMELKHPLVASASPLSGTVAGVKRLEDAGAAAVVMFSLFEEQLQHESAALEYLMTAGTESFAESLSYFPEIDDYTVGPDSYLDLLRRASEAVDIPLIGSLNGITNTGWIEYAKLMEEAGAKGV
jgi:dihydroorotate dehydrogenase (fumarate)